jgi:hypothetical protein
VGFYSLVVDPLLFDRLDGSGFVDFTERFGVRIDGIESSPKLQMRLRGTHEAIKQAARYLYARQKVAFAGISVRSWLMQILRMCSLRCQQSAIPSGCIRQYYKNFPKSLIRLSK